MYPKIKLDSKGNTRVVKVNGLPGIISDEDDDVKSLALHGGLDLSKFLKINEIDITHQVVPGQAYYFKQKKGKAKEYFHTLMPGEDLWIVSQRYGVKKKKTVRKKQNKNSDNINPGLVIWLRNIRPAEHPPEYVALPATVDQETLIVEEDTRKRSDDAKMQESIVIAPAVVEDPDYEDIIDEVENEEEAFYDAEIDDLNTASSTSSDSQNIPGELQAELNADENNSVSKNPLFHIIVSGETLYAVSRKYNVSVDDLLKMNDLSINESIRIGQKIYLKDPFEAEKLPQTSKESSKSETFITHIVKKGDTMYSISRKHNVTVDEILLWNNREGYNLNEGEEIIIRAEQ